MRRQLAAYYLAASGMALIAFTVSRWVYTKLDGDRLVKEVERHLSTAPGK